MLTGTDITSNGTANMQTSERQCENPECNINKLISMIPKRKPAQFIAEPIIYEKPMLVNGFTAVFQVDGSSAKLLDIKNPNGEGQTKTIYRIIPNSHVHVVNYVVVDTDETYLRKMKENDPVTMHKLLNSQKESADQMLKKIMSGQGSSATAAMTTVVSTINNNNSNTINIPLQPPSNSVAPASSTVRGQIGNNNHNHNNSIKLPLRMHPNLKITAVASGEGVITPPNVTPTPFIVPVPLTNLQAPVTQPPPVVSTQLMTTVEQPANNATFFPSLATDSTDKVTYDKMQAEINDLRRTVAMLAEAQAKNQQQPQTTLSAKRSRS